MSGIIAYAYTKYRRRNSNGHVVWQEDRINKRDKQSDRAFMKECDRLIRSHDAGRRFGTDIAIKEKACVIYYNKFGNEVSMEALNYVR